MEEIICGGQIIPKHKDIWSLVIKVSTPKTRMTQSLLPLNILFTVYLVVCLFLEI